MKGIVDRFEGEYAVIELEDQKLMNLLIKDLPKDIKEGQTIEIDGKNIIIDYDETNNRKKRINKLMDDLFQ